MPSKNTPGGLPSEVVEAALGNPKIRKRAERIMDRLFDEVEITLSYGTAAERASLVKNGLPSVFRSLQSAQQDAAQAAMQAEYQQLRELFGAFINQRGVQGPSDDPADG